MANKNTIERSYNNLLARLMRVNVKRLSPYFNRQGRRILKKFRNVNLQQQSIDIVDDLADWEEEEEELTAVLTSMADDSYRSGVRFATRFTDDLTTSSDIVAGGLATYTAVNIARAVASIISTTRKKLANNVRKGLAEDESREEISKRLNRTMVGAGTSRARTIAETETHNAINAGSFDTALLGLVLIGGLEGISRSGVATKTWNTRRDERVRTIPPYKADHAVLDRQRIPITDKFSNGLLFPGDAANGPPEEIIRCRCYLTFK